MVDWSHVFGQFMTNCSLFDVSKYLDSRLIQADKTEKCQTHDFYLKHSNLGKLQQLYCFMQDWRDSKPESRVLCYP